MPDVLTYRHLTSESVKAGAKRHLQQAEAEVLEAEVAQAAALIALDVARLTLGKRREYLRQLEFALGCEAPAQEAL